VGAENVIHALLPAVVDKPGRGASTGDWTRLTLHDRAAETLAAVADQPEIDANRILHVPTQASIATYQAALAKSGQPSTRSSSFPEADHRIVVPDHRAAAAGTRLVRTHHCLAGKDPARTAAHRGDCTKIGVTPDQGEST